MNGPSPDDGDEAFPTLGLDGLMRMAAESLVATLACGVVVYAGYLGVLWLQRLLAG